MFRPSVRHPSFIHYPHFRPPAYTVALSCPSLDHDFTHMADRNPKVVWNSLTSVHRARGFGSRLQLRRNFITATMKEDQSMEGWIGEVRGLANRLKAINVNVSDEDTIVVLTAGLPPSYTPIVISFDASALRSGPVRFLHFFCRTKTGPVLEVSRTQKNQTGTSKN